MTLTPEDIERKVFKQEFRGYHQEEVDTFLDSVVDRMVELIRERDLLSARVAEAERQADERIARAQAFADERIAEISAKAAEAIENEQLLKRALVTAERAAGEMLSQAKVHADQALAQATTKAERLVGEARREAEQALASARSQATEMLAEARGRAEQSQESQRFEFDRIRRTVTDFTRLRDEYRDRVRAALHEQLERFEQAGDLPDVPAHLIDLSQVCPAVGTELADWRLGSGQDAYAGNGDLSRSSSE